MLVKPMNTNDLLLQIEALLVTHEDKKQKAKQASQPDYAVATAKKATEHGARPPRPANARPAAVERGRSRA